MHSKFWILITFIVIFLVPDRLAGIGLVSAASTGTASGVVVDASGPVVGAIVRERATENYTFSIDDGSFSLGELSEGIDVEVTAWAEGYYVASTHIIPPVTDITLTLRPYHTTDNPDYEWISPISGTSDSACGNCHPMVISQWENNAHGGAISNERFFSLYNGTDVSGLIQVGPGYLNDFPGTSGSCANCHAPGAGVDGYLTTNMNTVRDSITSGIHCDFCHKVGGAFLDPSTDSVYPNMPGVQSLRILRPPAEDNIFFGPFDDIKDPDTFLPLISQSQYCAACHQFSFWGTPIYESYEEWLDSDYANQGITCQDCHMPPSGDSFFALPEEGGLEHPPEKIPSHFQVGASDAELLQDTVSMEVSTQQNFDQIEVSVRITNSGAGHHVPTDYPGRQMILVITALDEKGEPLHQSAGLTIPEWGGNEAGLPGTAFAKVLRDIETGESPVVNYWKQTLIVSDNRIPALATHESDYSFALPPGVDKVFIKTQLKFRRVFQEIAEQKGWNKPDIFMEESVLEILLPYRSHLYIPIVSFQ